MFGVWTVSIRDMEYYIMATEQFARNEKGESDSINVVISGCLGVYMTHTNKHSHKYADNHHLISCWQQV